MTLPDLARARILVTNDDGIHAPGLDALIEIAGQLSSDVWVVAPEVNQSGAGHSLSLSRPIRCRHVTEARYAVEGTPTDCVLFAVKHLLKAGEIRSWSLTEPVLMRELLLATSTQRPMSIATRLVTRLIRDQVQAILRGHTART